MLDEKDGNKKQRRIYRPEQQVCPNCGSFLERSHILWRKGLIFVSGAEAVESWVYRCPGAGCSNHKKSYSSVEAERYHLKYRRYSRELIVKIGYRRFWQYQTIYELHDWLTQDLGVRISPRQICNVISDFLALLRAGQAQKVDKILQKQRALLISIDGMQPEKGNRCLYIIREVQCGQTLLAESLDDGSHLMLSEVLLDPLKVLATALDLSWLGVVSDAQESIRLAVAQSLPGVAHQVCQAHCLRAAGQLSFASDRNLKKRLKATFRRQLAQVQKLIAKLATSDRYRPVLADYADALQSTLLAGGLAPFDFGGLNVYTALESLAASLQRCQKKGGIRSCSVC